MTNDPQKPNIEPNSEQAGNVLDQIPNELPEEARQLYHQGYSRFIRENGNNPELAHHAGMTEVSRHFDQNQTSGQWTRKK